MKVSTQKQRRQSECQICSAAAARPCHQQLEVWQLAVGNLAPLAVETDVLLLLNDEDVSYDNSVR